MKAKLKRGDRVIFTGKTNKEGWTRGEFIQYLPGGRVEILPDGCRFVTVDPYRRQVEKEATP